MLVGSAPTPSPRFARPAASDYRVRRPESGKLPRPGTPTAAIQLDPPLSAPRRPTGLQPSEGSQPRPEPLECVSQNHIGLDPLLHGIWIAHVTSDTKGKTSTQVNPPAPLCRAYATKVQMADGKEYRVSKVFIIRDDDGQPANVIRFENGISWVVTKKPGSPYFLMQMLDSEMDEMMRVVFTIQE